jgi:Protein of unknown function (DUF3141)
MAEAVTGTSPLQVLRPPRVLDELSGRIDQLTRTAVNDSARVWQKSVPPSAFSEYVGDFWQRSVLFLDILRERGNQHQDMLAHGVSLVLMYDSELVMRGDELPHPVNYSLLRVIPPEGAEIDDRKRPVFVIDPRAGQGPGIGGFKQLSEIGEAFRAGHPVYFAGFTASPVEGQRIEDVARAFTVFIEKVAELHPEALGKPFVFGNCQAGWRAMMAACMRPDVVGPMVIVTHGCARQSHVSALARDDHPFSSVRYQGPHAQSRAGTYDPDRTGGLPSSRPDRTHVRVGRHCCCGEIIDDLQRAQSKASMQITGRK